MRIEDNPFYILGVEPSDNFEIITEKWDEKSLMAEGNEKLFDSARQILTAPNKRVVAEVSWFYKLHYQDYYSDVANFDFLDYKNASDEELTLLHYPSGDTT